MERIPYEERLAAMDPRQRMAHDIQMEAGQETLAWMKGEGSVPSDIQDYLRMMEVRRREAMIRGGQMPGSTSFAQGEALAGMETARALESIRASRLSTAEGIAGSRYTQELGAAGATLEAGLAFPAARTGAASGIGTALQALAANRAGQFGAESQAYQGRMGLTSDIIGIGGTLALASAISSAREYKEDIEEMEPSEAMKKLAQATVYRFKYRKGIADEDEHVGIMADDAPDEVRRMDGKAVDLMSEVGMTIAGLKDVHKRLKKLEKKGGK
jgi:hypothetical protein